MHKITNGILKNYENVLIRDIWKLVKFRWINHDDSDDSEIVRNDV